MRTTWKLGMQSIPILFQFRIKGINTFKAFDHIQLQYPEYIQ